MESHILLSSNGYEVLDLAWLLRRNFAETEFKNWSERTLIRRQRKTFERYQILRIEEDGPDGSKPIATGEANVRGCD